MASEDNVPFEAAVVNTQASDGRSDIHGFGDRLLGNRPDNAAIKDDRTAIVCVYA